MSGAPSQFFLNLPFGETMIDQTANTPAYNSPYKFNGKELDEGTGMYYYGARYYDPRISVWMSVDPLAEKFPNYSPYNYVLNSPVKLSDPDGKIPIIPIILAAWAAIEFGLSVYDAYSTTETLMDPNATTAEKVTVAGGFIIGIFAPGGGYGTVGKQGIKQIEKVGAKTLVKIGGKEVNNIDEFYKLASKLDPQERVSEFKRVGKELADKNGWVKNNKLSTKNNRTIYTNSEGQHFSLDTQHGSFEMLDKKGKHLGEVDFSGELKKGADKSGKHNIEI